MQSTLLIERTIEMEQGSIFDIPKIIDDGFRFDNEGKLIGVDIKQFSKWWEDYKKNMKEEDKRIEESLVEGRKILAESEKLVREWKDDYYNRLAKQSIK